MTALTLREVVLDDVKRLLPRGDDRLRRAVRRMTADDRAASATALLDLLRVIRPFRTSLAAAGLAGREEPVPASGPWSTEVAASELPPRVRWLGRPSWDDKWMQTRGHLTHQADLRLVNPLLARLRDGPPDAGEFIAERMLPRYGAALLPDLRRGLCWDDRRAQFRALGAICRIDGKVGAELCAPRLEDPDFKVRHEALLCLALAAPAEARRIALAWLDGAKSRPVRWAAWQCLYRARPVKARDLPILLRALPKGDSYRASETILSAGRAAIRPLIELLRSPDPHARAQAAGVLGALGARAADAVPVLIDLTRDPNTSVLLSVTRALERIGPAARAAVPRLIEMLSDRYCCCAAEALAVLGRDDPAAAAAILTHLETADRNLLEPVLNRVIELGPAAKAAVPRLAALLRQEKSDWHFRSRVAEALAAVGPGARSAVPALKEALSDRFESVRYPAAIALGQNGPAGKAALPVLLEAMCEEGAAWLWARNRRQGLRALAAIGRAAVPALTRVAQADPYEQARRDAAEALALIAGTS
jgi:HEAT repeat protein